jgi:hypothetical protein
MAGRFSVISLALAIACARCTTEEVELPRAPSAFAGFDRFAITGERVPLDASLSFDPDGDVLSYVWRLQASPEGSRASIAASSERVTSIVPDRIGTYVIALSVSDGRLSARDLVAFTATASSAAAARPALALSPSSQNLVLGSPVSISALTSTSGALEVQLVRTPAGDDPIVDEQLRFLPSRPGEYWISAVLHAEGASSAPAIATALVSEDATPRPRAVLEGPSLVRERARVLFDGRRSEGGAPLALTFSLIADPSGGLDPLLDVATGCPAGQCRLLLPSVKGLYVVALEIESNGVRGVTAVHAVEVE